MLWSKRNNMKQENKDCVKYLLVCFSIGYLISIIAMPVVYATMLQCKSADGLTNLAEVVPVWAWWVAFGSVGFFAGMVNAIKPIWEFF